MTDTAYPDLLVPHDGEVAVLTLNVPERRKPVSICTASASCWATPN